MRRPAAAELRQMAHSIVQREGKSASGGPTKNTRASRFVRRASRLTNLVLAGTMARAILRLIDAESRGRYVAATAPRSVGIAEGASERRAEELQLAARLAEGFGSCGVCGM